jgi:hypothetical protein
MGRLDGEKTAPFWGLYGFEIEKYVQNEICVKNLSQYSDEIQKHCFLENGWNHYFNNFAPLLPTIKIVGNNKNERVSSFRMKKVHYILTTPPQYSLLGFFLAQKRVQNDKKSRKFVRNSTPPWYVILNDSEESRILRGRMINENHVNFYYAAPLLLVRDEPQMKVNYIFTTPPHYSLQRFFLAQKRVQNDKKGITL